MLRSQLLGGLVVTLAGIATPVVANAQTPDRFDVVIQGGRVIDPETGLDAVRDVGIRGDRIVRVTVDKLDGKRVADARGLVVAPGFIDLHQHQQDDETYALSALQGVTTVLELEGGVPDIKRFIAAREGKTLIHYGASASYWAARPLAWGLPLASSLMGADAMSPPPSSSPATQDPATPEQLQKILSILRKQLDDGAIGIGMGLEYLPGTTREEVVEIFRLAAEKRRTVFVHARGAGRIEPGSSIESVLEVIGAAAATGASAHIVHVNSTCMADSSKCLALIDGARAQGLDITAEAYPYGVGATFISSAFFNDGWKERRGLDYADVEVPGTGERLTEARFRELRNSSTPTVVLIHINPDSVYDAAIRHPPVMIGSDGGKAHPRNTGSFARVLARYVRDQKSLTMVDAIRKMALMPAQRLENAVPAMKRKGRLQEGADADIAVFDPDKIQDNATFREPLKPSTGMKYVLVAGTLVVDNGKLTASKSAGRAVLATR